MEEQQPDPIVGEKATPASAVDWTHPLEAERDTYLAVLRELTKTSAKVLGKLEAGATIPAPIALRTSRAYRSARDLIEIHDKHEKHLEEELAKLPPGKVEVRASAGELERQLDEARARLDLSPLRPGLLRPKPATSIESLAELVGRIARIEARLQEGDDFLASRVGAPPEDLLQVLGEARITIADLTGRRVGLDPQIAP